MVHNQLKVLYPNYPPGVIDCSTKFPSLHVTQTCRFPGLMVEILQLLTREVNVTIVPFVIQDFGLDLDFLDIEYDGPLFKLLANQTIDLIALPMQITSARETMYSFTDSIYKVQTRIMKRVEIKSYAKLWAFFETYDKQTWIAFLIVWILQWLLCLIVHQVEAKMYKQLAPSALDTAWKVLKIQLMQFEAYEAQTLAGKFSMLLFSLLQSTILLGLYGSWILANIIQHESQESTQSVINVLQFLNSKEYYFVTNEPDTWFFETINRSTSFPYVEFRQAFQSNPLHIVNGVEQALNEVRQQNALTFMQDDDRLNFFSRPFCYFEAIRLGMPMASAHLMLRKGSGYIPLLNNAIKRNKAYLLRLSKKYSELLRMGRDCENNKRYKALSIEPYTGLCAVCLTIIIGAFGVLTIEILTSRYGI